MAIIRCIDFETTGLPTDEEKHAICEVGYVDFDDDEKKMPLPLGIVVNPGRPMPIPARAVHHMSDADVAGGVSPTRALMTLMDGDMDYFCAHNIDMEKAFFSGGEIPWICTYKIALRLWPDAPGHKLQELRYFLNVDDDPDFDITAARMTHRAADDAYICALVLRKIFAHPAFKLADALRWSKGPALVYMCFLKKHKGKPWSQVVQDDPAYMLWVIQESDIKDRDVLATCRYWLKLKGHIA